MGREEWGRGGHSGMGGEVGREEWGRGGQSEMGRGGQGGMRVLEG